MMIISPSPVHMVGDERCVEDDAEPFSGDQEQEVEDNVEDVPEDKDRDQDG